MIDVFASHFGLLDSEQAEAIKTVTALIESTENPCVLMGDFNCEPHSVHIQKLKDIICDTAPKVLDCHWLTYSTINPERKIDYIFAHSDFNVLSAEVLEDIASDHRPCMAELEL